MSLISVKNISFKYEKENILDDLSFDIEYGNFISLLGINGSGKSTLLKNINKILKPSSGKIYVNGKELSSIKGRDLAKNISTVNQYNDALRNTVYDMILVGRVPHMQNGASKEDYKKVEQIIQKLELEKYALRNANTLSGGEFQKVVLARALAQEPKVLLLDEPTSNLDIKNQIEVMRLVSDYCKEKKIAVIVSIHDLNLALRFADKFLLLKKGKIYDYGGIEVINNKAIVDVYGIETQIINHNNRKLVVLC